VDYKRLLKDPCAAISEMKKTAEGKKAVWEFARLMTQKVGYYLTDTPFFDSEISAWKIAAKLHLGGLAAPGSSSNTPGALLGVFINKGIVKAHFRGAHKCCKRGGGYYIRGGCLVNAFKLPDRQRLGFQKLVDEYNKHIKEEYSDTFEFISIQEWMKEEYDVVLV
jgi:hypothetical protein